MCDDNLLLLVLDVSEVVERLAVLLTDQQPSPSSHLDDTGLGLDTAGGQSM